MLGLRRQLIARILRLRMVVYDNHRLSDLISRVSTDTTVLRDVVAQSFVDLVAGGLTAVATVGLMTWIDPTLFALVAITVAAAAVIVASLLVGIRAASERAQSSIGAMTADLERALGAIRTVRASRAERREPNGSASSRSLLTPAACAAKLASLTSPCSRASRSTTSTATHSDPESRWSTSRGRSTDNYSSWDVWRVWEPE